MIILSTFWSGPPEIPEINPVENIWNDVEEFKN